MGSDSMSLYDYLKQQREARSDQQTVDLYKWMTIWLKCGFTTDELQFVRYEDGEIEMMPKCMGEEKETPDETQFH